MEATHHRLRLALLGGVLAALAGAGCQPSRELGGTPLLNATPDTRITGTPPTLLEAGFVVHFYWTGRDPDGPIAGFQWKLSDNGVDGISHQDTLTIDPATGQILHPWHWTAATDTIFVVSADIPDFPPDDDLEPRHRRAFQTHTLFVRAVDGEGAVDPSPAFMSFTSTTLLPWVRVDRPERLIGSQDAKSAPPTVTFGYTGSDPDFDLGVPTKIRYLWKRAWLDNPPHYVCTAYDFRQCADELASFADSAWSAWIPYPHDPEDRYIRFPLQPARDEYGERICYLFAIQAQDTAGATSVERVYGANVQNVFISPNVTPLLHVRERYLGQEEATGVNTIITFDIAQGQLLEFNWFAEGAHYAGLITAYRYGWDLTDSSDENDPNWAVLPGNTNLHRRAPPRSFGVGVHSLTVQCWDNSNQITRITYLLDAISVLDPLARRPLLLIDDVKDRTSGAWSCNNGAALDNDRYRDDFWLETLGGGGGVEGFDPAVDVFDTESDHFGYRDLVRYRTVIWTTRYAQNNYIWEYFKPPTSGADRYTWLSSFQEGVGNLFLVGQRALNQFIEEKRWMVPWVFDANLTTESFGNEVFQVGFGTRTLADGTVVIIGRGRYPFRSIGIATLDQTLPRYNVYGRRGYGSVGATARDPACVGVKGLVLDEAFKAQRMPEGGAFADTILTSPLIDCHDLRPGYRDSLRVWDWGGDEIYDANLPGRSTPWSPQECADGPCIEPMFRAYSRFDWVRDLHRAAGDSEWPASLFDADALLLRCGWLALEPGEDRTVTNDRVIGFISHKLESTKPTTGGDVVWGFDPYRFETEEIRKAIGWVLGDYLLLPVRR
jgi:hypothetical protein